MASAQTLLEKLGAPTIVPRLEDSAVVIIDAQREYLDGNLPLVGIQAALQEIERLLARARQKNVPIFHIQHLAPNGAALFAADSKNVDFIESVRPTKSEPVVVKHLPNSFAGTNLDVQLRATGKTNVILAGFMTHMCVGATARGAQENGFIATVIDSACATRDLPGAGDDVIPAATIHSSNLASLSDLIALIAPDVSSLRD
jgi:nicotinamidase-related amidase